jgi:N-acyl homoserine lactone hydrolase
LELHVFETGKLSLPRGFVLQGGSWFERQELPVLAYVVRHPDGRSIVFDTGFNPKVNTDPNRYLGFMVSILGGFAMAEGQDLVSQLREVGIDSTTVSHVVVSHLHFDHAGMVAEFPGAELVVDASELAAAHAATTDASLYNALDYESAASWKSLELDTDQPLATFVAHVDLLGDGSLYVVALPGHTAGGIGLLVRLADGPVLLAADAAPVEESWRYAAMPFWAEDRDAWWETIWRIKRFLQLVPDAAVLGGHDAQALSIEDHRTIIAHPFETKP